METTLPDLLNSRYFVCETMITAGPRKKPMSDIGADKDLGEDVAGFLFDSRRMLVWLLDGTSDLHCLRDPETNREYFSSRMLALAIAAKLRTRFFEAFDADLSDIIPGIIMQVKKEWIRHLTALPEQEHAFLKKNILNRNYPECAATIFAATLGIDGKLRAYRCGDSKAYVYSADHEQKLKFENSSLNRINTGSNDRIFFRLVLADDGSYDISCNEILHESLHVENVTQLVFFSDGINAESEQLLKYAYATDQEKTRQELFHLSQQTGDDKTICFTEIRTAGI